MTTHSSSRYSNDDRPADLQEAPHALGVGHRLDEFELSEVIGEGGFGIVYLAWDHSLRREVAIKEYMPSMLVRRVADNSVQVRSERLTATFEAGLRSFINEARTLAQFSHPALVRVHRFWESNATAYMAIQLYRGRTLRRLAEDEPATLCEPWLLGMLGPLLGALETLHRSECFHRDIAPDNIFIQQDGQPVLLDFGAARKSIADLADEVAIMVKSGYSPIEQYADDNALRQGPWTDLYALGAVLYRAVTGHPPPSAVVRSVQDAYVPLSSMGRADLSPAFCAAVDHALAVHSAERTPSVAAFAAELGLVKLGEVFASQSGARETSITGEPIPPALAPSSPSSSSSSSLSLSSLAALSSASASASAFAGQQASSPPAPSAEEFVETPPPVRPLAAPAVSKRGSNKAPRAVATPSPMPLWGLVGVFLFALAVIGGWPGQRWGSSKHDATAPSVPPPIAGTASPPAAVGPSSAAATAAEPAAANPTESIGTTSSEAGESGRAAFGRSAAAPVAPAGEPAAGPAARHDNVPTSASPGSAPLPANAAVTAELDDWNLARSENTREGYEAYLRRYRRGFHARQAQDAIADLSRGSPPLPLATAATPPARPAPKPINSTPAVIASGTATAPAAGPALPPVPSRVVLNIRPWGQVWVDGVDRGVSPPLKSLPLPAGTYNVEVRNGDLDAHRQRVTVQEGRPAPVVSHEFR